MAEDQPPPSLTRTDYAAIEAAVMETTRGRWFLAEYARRNRHADTEALLGALGRIETSLALRPVDVAPVAEAAAVPAVPKGSTDAIVPAQTLAAIRQVWLTVQAIGGAAGESLTAEAASLSLARRLGGFAQDARDAATALQATARDIAAIVDATADHGLDADLAGLAQALALIVELEQVTARRLAGIGAEVIGVERLLSEIAGVEAGVETASPAAARAETAARAEPALPAPDLSSEGQADPPRTAAPPPLAWGDQGRAANPPASRPPLAADPRSPPSLGPVGTSSAPPRRPSFAELQKMPPLERLKAMS